MHCAVSTSAVDRYLVPPCSSGSAFACLLAACVLFVTEAKTVQRACFVCSRLVFYGSQKHMKRLFNPACKTVCVKVS